MRAEARGPRDGILGWHQKAVSAYTWCITEKGPQKEWLHFIKKADTPECCCHKQIQSGEHLVERCDLLMEEREKVKRKELGVWKMHHIQQLKKKGPVEPEKEKE